MDFGFSEEQQLLREQIARLLADQSPLPEVRRVAESRLAYSPTLWKQLAEMGITGLVIPEPWGGAGLGWVELVVVLEETGRALLPSPFLSNTLAIWAIGELGDEAQRQKWLPRLAEGSRIGSVALLEASDDLEPSGVELLADRDGEHWILRGEKRFVPDVEAADFQGRWIAAKIVAFHGKRVRAATHSPSREAEMLWWLGPDKASVLAAGEVHFIGWNSRHDEEIFMSGKRLRKPGSK